MEYLTSLVGGLPTNECRNCGKEFQTKEDNAEFHSRDCEVAFWKGAGIDIDKIKSDKPEKEIILKRDSE